uniref:Uncharacterized protein n=1 Tax=Anguilla anguilla TaxID=7936 RepID=A0A0E9TTN7_ANGAN
MLLIGQIVFTPDSQVKGGCGKASQPSRTVI